jgi:signal transduction histidine kinase
MMRKYPMKWILVLMCLSITAVVILQGIWLMDSYAVSKEKKQADIKKLLDVALIERDRQLADTVRILMQKVVRNKNDFGFRIFDFTKGIQIGFNNGIDNSYAMYDATSRDTLAIHKDPHVFFVRKMSDLTFSELKPLYSATIGINSYPDGSPEKAAQMKLTYFFHSIQDTTYLANAVIRTFADAGQSFIGKVRWYKDLSDIYTKKVVQPPPIKKKSAASREVFGVIPGSDDKQSLGYKLDLLQSYIDSLNVSKDSVFVSKPILNDINDVLRGEVPTVLLSVKTPYTAIGRQMLTGILGSVIALLFVGMCMWVMYNTIVKQKQLAEIKDDFISNISHELKTPITTAQAAVQGLKFVDLNQNPGKTSIYLRTATSEIQRLSLMVDQILNVSLYENGGFQLNPEGFDFKTMLNSIADSQQLRKEKQINVSVRYEAETDVFADKLHIQNVVVHLIDNAIKYSADTVSIAINCRKVANGIQVSVMDNGIGIPAEFRGFIFDKFFRVPDLNGHRIKGYGLGLSYVKAIIEKHGGSIGLGRCGESGTEFIFTLPESL